jgi:Zn-dependent protease
MSTDHGPWGARDGSDPVEVPTSVTEHRLGPVSVRIERTAPTQVPVDKGQHPVWAIVSTALLGGFIWYVTGSWVVAGAAIFGLFVHEYGHVLAMNRLGMGPARIYIVPFLGGVARSQRLPQSEWHGVLVSLAGPLFGILATLPFFAAWALTGGKAWLVAAFAISMINLINLAPAPPLDGSKALGPVLAKIHPMLEKAAMLLVGGLVVFWGISNGSWFFAGFLALALFGHLRRGTWRPEGRVLTGTESVWSVGLFVATVLICGAAAMAALVPLSGSVEGAVGTGLRYLEFGR